jgi:hypothetical protein
MNNDDNQTCLDMVNEMLREGDGFTVWELEFLEDVSKRKFLTDKQMDCIENIYKKRM